jgi:hypothetical protein
MPAPRDQSQPDPAEALLGALIELFRERAVDRLATEEIVAALAERLGRPVTANRLARAHADNQEFGAGIRSSREV